MNGWKTVPAGLRLLAAAFVVISLVAPAAQAQTPAEIQAALDAAHAKFKDLEEGKWVKVLGWEGPEAARQEVRDGMVAWAAKHR